jgi:hypothetical protein
LVGQERAKRWSHKSEILPKQKTREKKILWPSAHRIYWAAAINSTAIYKRWQSAAAEAAAVLV